MPKRSRRTPDINKLAAMIVEEATEGGKPLEGKNPAAVALGRRGGLKGGKSRAQKLNPEERKRIAQTAAHARWAKRRKSQ